MNEENETRATQTASMLDSRFTPQALSEVRAVTNEDGQSYIDGHGIVFNSPSQPMRMGDYRFIEYIDERAADDVNFDNAVAFFNHDPNYILGSRSNKTIEFEKTPTSIHYKILAPDTQVIRDLVIAPIARGDVKGSSFMFNIASSGDEWEFDPKTMTAKRYIRKISEIHEMGPVSMPAYAQSTSQITKRSFDQFIKDFQQQEQNQAAHYRRLSIENRLKLRQRSR